MPAKLQPVCVLHIKGQCGDIGWEQGAVVMWAEVMVRRRQDMARASNGSADSTRGRDPGRQSASHNPALDGIQAIEQYAREVLLQTPQKRGKLQPNTAFAVQAQNKLLTQL